MTGRRVALSIVIDPIKCDAFGYCAELLPDHVSLDEWGYPIVRGERLPDALVDRAREAARQCPRRAVVLAAAPGAARIGPRRR